MSSEANETPAQPPIEHWWAWDAAESVFRHRLSGEELRYMGPIAGPISSIERTWHRFDYIYEPERVRYPLLVHIKQQSFAPRPLLGGNPYFVERQLIVWRLDHLKSAEVWQAEHQLPTVVPPYGLWRRADDAFWGALLQFRPMEIIGPSLDLIAINGGWWNGTWRPEFYRRYCSNRVRFPRFDNDAYDPRHDRVASLHRHQIREYAMVRLDAPPPHWVPHQAEVCAYEKRWPPKREYTQHPCLLDKTTGALLHNFSLGVDERKEEDRFGPSPLWRLELPGCPIYMWPPFDRKNVHEYAYFRKERAFLSLIGNTWWDHWFSTIDSPRLAKIIAERFVMPGIQDIEAALAESWRTKVLDSPSFHPVYLLWSDAVVNAVPLVTSKTPGDPSDTAIRLWQAGTLIFTPLVGGLATFATHQRLALQLEDDPEGDDWVRLFA